MFIIVTLQIWIVVFFLLSTIRDQIDCAIEHDVMDAHSCDTIVTWQSLIVITCCAKFNVAIIVVMIIIALEEIEEKTKVKKQRPHQSCCCWRRCNRKGRVCTS